jgi:hypothetical protein
VNALQSAAHVMTMPVVDIGGIRVGLEGLDLGLHVAVRSRYERFLSDEPAHFVIAVTVADDLPHAPVDPVVERRSEHVYAVTYGILEAELDLAAARGRATVLSNVYMVDSLLRITLTLLALERDAVLVHSSGVRVGDRILVCFGPSGVGKTTVARSVNRKDVLCDEMMLVRADGTAAGTPFHGDLMYSAPGIAPLYALCRLHQGEVDALTPLPPGQAARTLLNSVLFFSSDADLSARLLDLALRISTGRTYSLTFKKGTHVPTFIGEHVGRDAA